MEKIQAFFKTTIGNSFAALASASAINLLATPYETTKAKISSSTQNNSNAKPHRPYYSVPDCFFRTINQEGFGALLKTNSLKNFIPFISYQTLTFTVFYSLQNLYPLKEQFQNPTFTQSLFLNTLFGISSAAVSLIKLQAQGKSPQKIERPATKEMKIHKKSFQNKNEIYKRHSKNIKASQVLDECFKPSLIGHFLGRGIYFGFYESGKNFMSQNCKGKLFWQGMLGLAVSYCSERAESRINWIQKIMNITRFRLGPNSTKLDCFRYIVQNQGWMAFVRWYEPWALRNIKVKNALMLVLFGRIHDELSLVNDQTY